MTERPSPYLLACREPDEQRNTSFPLRQLSITLDDPDFRQGYQEGHLTYMVHDRNRQHSDESIAALVSERLESLDHSSLHGTGFLVGWLVTLVTRGMQQREGA